MRKLEIDNGPNQGRTLSLRQGSRFIVGRCRSCDFPIVDPRMSRQHFVVEEQGDAWVIQDLSSANGTWVNDRRINQAVLNDADKILAGDTILLVTSRADARKPDLSHADSGGAHFMAASQVHRRSSGSS